MSVESAPMQVQSTNRWRVYPILKRLGDIVFSLVALATLAPIFLLIACLVKCNDRGCVLYCHDRVGRGGRLFRFYKFRSMVPDADAIKSTLAKSNEADGPIFKMKEDPRVTPIGRQLRRFSLDELPQFWNVLRGDMSLVGPRPHLPSEIAACPDYPQERLTVPPGLICLREINGRSKLTFAEWLESDLEYVRRRSLWLDVQILVRAIPAILLARGAY